MKYYDKIKLIIVAMLFGAIGVTHYLYGKESVVTKTVVAVSLVIWLISMMVINRKRRKQE